MPTFREMLAAAKAAIREITTAEAEEELARPGAILLDVREPDEYEQGAVAGSVHLPRGNLESSIEGRIPDKVGPRAGDVRRRRPVGLRRRHHAAARLHRRRLDDGRLQPVEGRGPGLVGPPHPHAEQRNRYQRHLLLPEVGETGQLKLLDSKVLLLGAGGLGSPAALYLAAAGVGTLGIIDMDVVDASNLQRQILHNTDRIGERKVDSAKKTLTLINPDVNVVTYDVRLGADNILDIIDGYDVIVDGTDNFPTRYLVNDASLLKRIPVVHGSIFRFEGQATVFNPYEGPCYRCLLPEPPPAELAPSCSEAGVLGVLPGIIGSHPGRRGHQDAARASATPSRAGSWPTTPSSRVFRTFKVRRDPACPACGPDAGEIVIAEYDDLCMPHVIEAPRSADPAVRSGGSASSPRMMRTAADTSDTRASGSAARRGPSVRPRWIQMVRRPTPWPPRMSAGPESPTIHPSRPTPHLRAASVEDAGVGLPRVDQRRDATTASTSSPNPVTSSFRSWNPGPLVTTATFHPADRSRRNAFRESAGNTKAVG